MSTFETKLAVRRSRRPQPLPRPAEKLKAQIVELRNKIADEYASVTEASTPEQKDAVATKIRALGELLDATEAELMRWTLPDHGSIERRRLHEERLKNPSKWRGAPC